MDKQLSRGDDEVESKPEKKKEENPDPSSEIKHSILHVGKYSVSLVIQATEKNPLPTLQRV